jgi:hypothetical protein
VLQNIYFSYLFQHVLLDLDVLIHNVLLDVLHAAQPLNALPAEMASI